MKTWEEEEEEGGGVVDTHTEGKQITERKQIGEGKTWRQRDEPMEERTDANQGAESDTHNQCPDSTENCQLLPAPFVQHPHKHTHTNI